MSLQALLARAAAEAERKAAEAAKIAAMPIAQRTAEAKQIVAEAVAELGTIAAPEAPKLTGLAALLARKAAVAEAKHVVADLQDGESESKAAAAIAAAKAEPDNKVAAAVAEMRSDTVAKSHNKAIAEVYGGIAPQVELDDSQKVAVAGLVAEQFACLVGYAGTGKTTTLRAFVAELLPQIPPIAIGSLGHLSDSFNGHECRHIPSIAFAAFTGRAAKQMAGSLPECFRRHCSTIHRLLGFKPEFYEAEQFDDNGRFLGMKNSMRMVPTHDKRNPMPWNVIVIDEASMVGLDLWELFIAACKPTCRIYMVGDLSQLPPVFGDAVFGMAIHKWPTFELAKIHRQAEGSPIIANAARIRNGDMPVKADQFQLKGVDMHAQSALKQICEFVKAQHKAGLYDETQDICITTTNVGATGQEVMNVILRQYFNPDSDLQLVYAGREKMRLAIGDRVMFTGKNNWTLGITNGEIGIVRDIRRNPDYSGPDPDIDSNLNLTVKTSHQQLNLDDMNALMTQTQNMIAEAIKKRDSKEEPEDEDTSAGKRQSSHIISVEFVALDRTFDLKDTGSVSALKHAYSITCHKSQGGQWRNVFVCLHKESAGKLISREWFYTAVTRARESVVVLTNKPAIAVALERGEYPAGPAARKAEWLIEKMVNNETFVHVANQVPDCSKWDTSKPLVDAMEKK